MFDTNSFTASTPADTSIGLDEMYVESFTVIIKSVLFSAFEEFSSSSDFWIGLDDM